MTNKRVIVGLSGGVDSSVAAALLQRDGYEVIGVYILGWMGTKEFPCSWQEEEQDARRVAEKLNIPFYVVNLSKQYEKAVIDDFFAVYRAGQTPNPDILCNSEIKFGALWQELRQFEPDFFATGHYVRIEQGQLAKAVDATKDQSYFLWNINREILPKLLFPLGTLTKNNVRLLAKEFALPTAKKKDSQGICFVGPLKVRAFLKSVLRPVPGLAYLPDGRKIAEHDGAALYTIGQRLGTASVDWTGDVPPLFVLAKDVQNNRLIVGRDQELLSQAFTAKSPNWLTERPDSEFDCLVKLRYRQDDVAARVQITADTLEVKLSEPVRAITPGQSLVMYSSDGTVLGGAVISQVPSITKLLANAPK